jgi:hypothetical protein
MTMNIREASTVRIFLLRLASTAATVTICALISSAGGPKKIAGTAYFDSSVTGQPLTWAQGAVIYYTDQGNLSVIFPNASANSLVAGAFSQWTEIPTAALTVTAGGSLAEDVSSANVTRNADGTISIPADIQPNAIGAPIGIVYDFDGAVTSALLGAGAGDRSQCFSNAVFGGTDNFSALAAYQHALVVINGQCAQQSSQITDVQYRLVRVIGSVLGLGWSQLNLNVLTGSPPATSDDYAGFPVMHFTDPLNCIPITLCYADPLHLSMDDSAAISRLYPVTVQNQAAFQGKRVFSDVTARIHGSVWFTDTHGLRTQPMQGVNVVARWIDPSTNQASRRYAASSVSGFLFTGNQGNAITGTDDVLGDPLAAWGSQDETLEGFFDLAGLQVPNGGSARYELSVEILDAQRSSGVGPYSPGPVSMSGSFQPITVTVSEGGDAQQDILMTRTAQASPERASSWTVPALVPRGGDWASSLREDEADYFLLPIRANRTLSITATALDESSRATLLKAQPVIGIWPAAEPEGTAAPAYTPSPFNSLVLATSRLDAQVLQTGNFLIGISDIRGRGRPDFHYHGRVLYADTVSPARVSVNGKAISVQGTGFARGLTASMGGTALTQLALSASQMMLVAPPHSDGPQSIVIRDSASGASTTMTNVLTYGAHASDNLVVIYTGNPQTPVGTQSAKPVTVRVVAADAVTPIEGATVGWTTTNSLQLSACGGATSCSRITDQDGYVTTWLTPVTAGASTVTATLAPGVYSPAKSVSATLNATQSASDISALTPTLWVSQGATITLPLTVRAVSNGAPRIGVQINFAVMTGAGNLTAATAQTNSTGYATVNLMLAQIAAEVRVSACVAPNNVPCAIFYANSVPLSQQRLQPVSGAGQVSTGQAFQPVIVRVTDSASPPNSVAAAPVQFQTTLLRRGGISPAAGDGEINAINPAMPVILQVAQTVTSTDINGLANLVASRGTFSAPFDVEVLVAAGSSAWLDFPLEVLPSQASGNNVSPSNFQPIFRPLRSPLWRGGADNR